jgi:hypothetical protein
VSVSSALSPSDFLRSVGASRDTLGRTRMKLLDVVVHVRALTHDAPYCIIGGLAQILWARKTHTDDLDVALATSEVAAALATVQSGRGGEQWALPAPPDKAWETDDVIDVCHLLYDGAVVDLIAFKATAFNTAILAEAIEVPELGNLRVIRPEHLLVTHLLRPGPLGALAAVELVIARRAKGGVDESVIRTWADRVGRGDRLARVLEQAKAFDAI